MQIIATKGNARLEIFENEYSTFIDLNSGDKSPNIYWNPSEGIKFSSGNMTENFRPFLKIVEQLSEGYPLKANLELIGWTILVNHE